MFLLALPSSILIFPVFSCSKWHAFLPQIQYVALWSLCWFISFNIHGLAVAKLKPRLNIKSYLLLKYSIYSNSHLVKRSNIFNHSKLFITARYKQPRFWKMEYWFLLFSHILLMIIPIQICKRNLKGPNSPEWL